MKKIEVKKCSACLLRDWHYAPEGGYEYWFCRYYYGKTQAVRVDDPKPPFCKVLSIYVSEEEDEKVKP